MMKIYTLIIVCLYLCACSANKDSKQIPLHERDTDLYKRDTLLNTIVFRPNYSLIKRDTSNIKLVFFDTIPETISNPAGFYTYDTTNLADNKFIFLTNLADYAIIRNNGKDIYLKKDYEKSLKISETTFKDVFSGNGYLVILTHKPVGHCNGVSVGTGTLKISNSKHQTAIKIQGGYKIS